MNVKNFFKESARDLIAFGGPIFFLLVLARVSITANFIYLSEFILAGGIFYALSFSLDANVRAGIGTILLIFTGIYYGSVSFAAFATIIYILFLTSLVYLGEKKKDVAKGVVLGLVVAGGVYYIVRLVFGQP